MPSEYRLRRRVQFYETDMAGIVHFSWFFRYLEEAEHAMWREAGLSIADGSEIGWPRGDTRIATGTLAIKCVSTRPGEPMRGMDIPPEIDALFQVATGT